MAESTLKNMALTIRNHDDNDDGDDDHDSDRNDYNNSDKRSS